MKILALLAASSLFVLPLASAQAADDAKATALLKKEGCMGCHSVSEKKAGPSFKSVAEKYKGDADAEKKIVGQVTTKPKHKHVKTKDKAAIQNLAQYILSR